jgi:hypothetical protein
MEAKEEHGMKKRFQKLVWTLMIGAVVLSPIHLLQAEPAGDSKAETYEVDVPLQEALSQLKKAETLESAYIGFAGSLSENLRQLQVLLSRDKAKTHFQELYQSGSLAAKMYAIIGLQLLEENAAAQSLLEDARQYQTQNIQVMEGCVIYQTQLDEVLDRIAKQSYAEEFKAALR